MSRHTGTSTEKMLRTVNAQLEAQIEGLKRALSQETTRANEAHNAALDAAAQAMQPLFRSMISRGQAAEKILALKHPAEPKA